MVYKRGFDGSSSHSLYKQAFVEDSNAMDSDLLLTSVAPLTMVTKTNSAENIVWQNPRSSSTRYCPPMKLQFLKESDDIKKRK